MNVVLILSLVTSLFAGSTCALAYNSFVRWPRMYKQLEADWKKVCDHISEELFAELKKQRQDFMNAAKLPSASTKAS